MLESAADDADGGGDSCQVSACGNWAIFRLYYYWHFIVGPIIAVIAKVDVEKRSYYYC